MALDVCLFSFLFSVFCYNSKIGCDWNFAEIQAKIKARQESWIVVL